jgi:hypothetical protein
MNKMLKPLAVAAISIAMLTSATAASDVEFLKRVSPVIAKNCSAKWASDYDMQLYCRQKQLKAVNAILNIRQRWLNQGEEKSRDEVAIMETCSKKWQWDFDMVTYCFQKQVQALAELHQQDQRQQPATRNAGAPAKTVPVDKDLLEAIATVAVYIGVCKPDLEPAVYINIENSIEEAIKSGKFTREEAKQAGPIVFAKVQKEGIGKWCTAVTAMPSTQAMLEAFGHKGK